MEAKLMNAAALLPEPELDFQTIEQHMKATVKPARKNGKALRVVLVAALAVVLLCGMGWAKTSMSYGMWTLFHSPSWTDAKWGAEKNNIQLPETMDGVPFDSYWVYGHVPQDGSWLRAFLSPLYVPRNVYYAVWETTEITLPDGSTSTYVYKSEDFVLNFGTTTNEIWRVYFNMDENGVWTGWEVPESYYTVEYEGVTLQIGETVSYNPIEDRDVYSCWVHWVDEEREIAFSLHEEDYEDPNRVVECAKMLIDMNR